MVASDLRDRINPFGLSDGFTRESLHGKLRWPPSSVRPAPLHVAVLAQEKAKTSHVKGLWLTHG